MSSSVTRAAMGDEKFGDGEAEARSATGDDCAHFIEIHQAASRSGSCSLPSMALRAWRHSAATASVPVRAVGMTGSRISIRSGAGCGNPPRGDNATPRALDDGRNHRTAGTLRRGEGAEVKFQQARLFAERAFGEKYQ